MSQQQQSFNAPENNPGSQPVFNPDPREQGPRQEGSNQEYQAGYSATGQQYGEKVYPTRSTRRRGRFRWLRITLLVVLVLIILSAGSYGVNQAFGKSATLTTQSFTVQKVPNLVIRDSLGTVHIQTGGSENIVIKGTKYTGFFGNLNDVQVNETLVGNELDVTVQSNTQGPGFLNQGRVDLNITVPTATNIQDTTNAGSLNIDGVTGQMNLQANAGSINVKNATLENGSTFVANAGSINVKNANLDGSSTFKANAGSINYSGTLSPKGNYDFQANAGSINLTLPASSSFILNASVNAGSVNNGFGSDTVGSAPFANISAHADAGSINIHKK